MGNNNRPNTGGQAFPDSKYSGLRDDCGMTLRDYFAAQAAAAHIGLLSDPDIQESLMEVAAARGVELPHVVAGMSYETADAMIAARDAWRTKGDAE